MHDAAAPALKTALRQKLHAAIACAGRAECDAALSACAAWSGHNSFPLTPFPPLTASRARELRVVIGLRVQRARVEERELSCDGSSSSTALCGPSRTSSSLGRVGGVGRQVRRPTDDDGDCGRSLATKRVIWAALRGDPRRLRRVVRLLRPEDVRIWRTSRGRSSSRRRARADAAGERRGRDALGDHVGRRVERARALRRALRAKRRARVADGCERRAEHHLRRSHAGGSSAPK